MNPADEWDTTPDPARLLELLGDNLPLRKARLFAVGYCRLNWHRVTSRQSRRDVETLERVADGKGTDRQVEAIQSLRLGGRDEGVALVGRAAIPNEIGWHRTQAEHNRWYLQNLDLRFGVDDASQAAGPPPPGLVPPDHPWHAAFQAAYFAAVKPKADLMRCVFPNPHRLIGFPVAWRTAAVLGLAESVYESRDFAALPVLADALEEAGCEHPPILAHCRGGGPHARGCWVVDAVLGKS